jgi:hypothetical protein
MADLARREPRDLDRRVEHDQFFKLNLQGFEIPLPPFRQAVGCKTQHALFLD